MYPLQGTERARHDISQTFEQYNLEPNIAKMIATDILPLHGVREAHGTYPLLPLKQLMKRVDTAGANPVGYALRRAPRSAYERNDLAFTQAAYNTEEHGLEGVVDRNEQMHYRNHFDHETTTALKTLHDVMLERELRTAAELFNTTRFVPGVAGQSQDAGTYRKDFTLGAAVPWSDSANSDPITDIFVSQQKIFQKFGCYADCLTFNETTLRHLRLNEKIRQEWMALGAGQQAYQDRLAEFNYRFESTENIRQTASAIARVLDVDEIIVGASVLDANNSNDPNFQAVHVWGNNALLFKKIRGTGGGAMKEIGIGHTLQWTPDTNNNPQVISTTHGMQHTEGFFVEDYYSAEVRSQIIRVRHQDRQLIKYNIGELITNV